MKAQVLKPILSTLIRGKQDLVLYGNKSSGKTTFATNLLNDIVGQQRYLSIKSIFITNRESLLYLVSDQLMRLLRKLDSRFFQKLQQNFQLKYLKQSSNGTSLQFWLKRVNKFIKINEQFFKKLPRLYIFIDNIQDLNINEQLLRQFYFGMKNQLLHIKFSFFFCGIAHKSLLFSVNQPIRLIPWFHLAQPCIKKIIQQIIYSSQLQKVLMEKNKVLCQKLLKHLSNNLYHAFQSIQYQIERMKQITKSFVTEVNQYVKGDMEKAKLWMDKNEQSQTQLLKKLQQFGPVSLQRVSQQKVKKNQGVKETEQGQATFYLQNYPSLITTSIGLANGYPETQDMRRFMDLTKTMSVRGKNNAKKKNPDNVFKYDGKKSKHAKQRIISISQVLQEQSKSYNNNRLKQFDLPHHSLDYYGCMQYLRIQGYINFYGRTSQKFGGTVSGNPKQSQVKDFMNKLGLSYNQFTGKD